MSVVIDASLTVAWYFDDEATSATEALFDRVSETGAIVPALWRLEVASSFQVAIRRKRIDLEYRDDSLADLAQLPIAVDAETDARAWSATLRIADRLGLTVYDAAYLELADRSSLPLATLDKELRRAASAAGVQLLGT